MDEYDPGEMPERVGPGESPGPVDENAPLPATKKASREEHDFRVRIAQTMLAKEYRRSEVTQFMMRQYGINQRMARKYIRKAEERMVAAIEKPLKQLIAERHEYMMGILRSRDASLRDKIDVLKLDNAMMGITTNALRLTHGPDVTDDAIDVMLDRLSEDELRVFVKIGEEQLHVERELGERERRREEERLRRRLSGPAKITDVDKNGDPRAKEDGS